jgi:hypothetical protein
MEMSDSSEEDEFFDAISLSTCSLDSNATRIKVLL